MKLERRKRCNVRLFLSAAILLCLTIIPIDSARADFLGLAPGDWAITLQDVGTPSLNNFVGRVHIPDGPVATSTFSWSFALRDCCGPVFFNWTDEVLLFVGLDGSSWAYEKADAPLRLCDIGAFCHPTFELHYAPSLNLGLPCAEGFCPRYFVDDFNYLVLHRGGWTAQRIGEVGEPSGLLLMLMGATIVGLTARIRRA